MNVVITLGYVLVAGKAAMQRQCGFDAGDNRFIERAAKTGQRFLAGGRVHDELADEAVVVRRHTIASIGCAIETDAEAAGGVEIGNQAG